jgi:putative thioredoxin
MMKPPALEERFAVRDFDREVIAGSMERPVLVDFWAPWCGPCRFLGPIVEKLADEAGGRWALVKVNTEERPDLAERYSIRGIPNLKLFVRGTVVAELSGALPEPQLRAWLEAHLPTPARERLAAAQDLMARGDEVSATAAAEEALEMDPSLVAARLLLARLVVLRDPLRTKGLLAGHAHLDEAADLLLLADAQLLREGELPEGPVKPLVWMGMDALRRGDADAAMEAWVEAVMRDKRWNGDMPRRLCVALLKLLGREHPVAQRWRRRFEMALY